MSTEEDFILDEADVRAMVALLGETCALGGTINDKKHHLMKGLGQLVDVQAWAWVHAVEMVPHELPVYVAFLHGGFSEEKLARFIKIQTHPDMARISTPLCEALQGRSLPLTRTLQQICPPEELYDAEVGAEWRACDVYPRGLFFYPQEDGTFSGVALYRRWDSPLFSPREAKIAHILLSEVPWLHAAHGTQADQAAQVPQLPVRQRLVLELLLQGYSRKAIADAMGVSINTVAGYVKEIYRFFEVSSHAELINRFFLGNGGDKV